MFTIDASVWISSFDPLDPHHTFSRDLVLLLRDRNLPVFVPNLVFVEIAGAIRRRRGNQEQATALSDSVRFAQNVAAALLDEVLEQQASVLAAQQALVVRMRFTPLLPCDTTVH